MVGGQYRNPHFASDAREFLLAMPICRSFGIEVLAIEHGAVTLRQPSAPALYARDNVFQAGPIATIGDLAAGTACLTGLPAGWRVATLEFSIKLISAAQGDALIARGKVLKSGSAVSFGIADIFSVAGAEERHCAVLTVTMRNIPPRE